jgi:tetraacyldisaccharide 4'-kinase
LPVAALYGALSSLRRGLYQAGLLKSERLPVPVVVVGNIYVGGTGKTPLTIWLADALKQRGYTPGIISRGYGADGALVQAVRADSLATEVGDEPLLIARQSQCPVFVGRKRVQAGRALLAAHPQVDVILTDDGLQHYALARDAEIILFDGRGVGNGWLLPAGPLRESPARRRDCTVYNAASAPDGAFRMQLGGQVAERLSRRDEKMALSALSGRRVAAAAGIGNPARFFNMLRAAGVELATELPLPDHHDFRDRPFDGIDADIILVTEKDAVKCEQLEHLNNDPRLWVVPVAAEIDPALANTIVEICRGRPTA